MKRLALTLIVLAAGCGGGSSSPTSPGAMPLVQSGTWTGILEITSCSSSAYGCRPGRYEDFSLRLAADGGGVAQLVPRGDSFGVDVTAVRQPDGTFLAGGTSLVNAISRTSSIDAQFTLARVEPAALTGTVTYTFTDNEGAQVRTAKILTSRAVEPVLPGRLHGTWIGHLERTSCTGTCNSDPLLFNAQFLLSVSQTQSSLTGVMGFFGAFTSQATGSGFSLALSRGTLDDPTCRYQYDGVTCYVDLSNFTVNVDALDRMQGTFQYRYQAYPSSNVYVSLSGAARLAGVVRWP